MALLTSATRLPFSKAPATGLVREIKGKQADGKMVPREDVRYKLCEMLSAKAGPLTSATVQRVLSIRGVGLMLRIAVSKGLPGVDWGSSRG